MLILHRISAEGRVDALNAEITNAIVAAGPVAQYDEQAKRLLGNKWVLGHILRRIIPDFHGMSAETVATYIEGSPMISAVPVEPGLTNTEIEDRVIGFNTESSEIHEGTVRFDVVCYVRLPDGMSQIILNVEAQKDEPGRYHIVNRAVYYASRLMASQKGRDFSGMTYDKIKNVYSVWICMNEQENRLQDIHLTSELLVGEHAWKWNPNMMHVILFGLGKDLPEQNDEMAVHRLLGTLLSHRLTPQSKLNIIKGEYRLPLEMSAEEVSGMCNLGEWIVEDTTNEVTARYVNSMSRKGYTSQQIADALELDEKAVQAILDRAKDAVCVS